MAIRGAAASRALNKRTVVGFANGHFPSFEQGVELLGNPTLEPGYRLPRPAVGLAKAQPP
jgi:hypothetical protein